LPDPGATESRHLHQLLDPVDHRGVKARQRAGLDVEAPLLDPVEQLRALQPQFFRQLVTRVDNGNSSWVGPPACQPVEPERSVLCPVRPVGPSPVCRRHPGCYPGQDLEAGVRAGDGLAWSTRSGRKGGSPVRYLMVGACPVLFPQPRRSRMVPSGGSGGSRGPPPVSLITSSRGDSPSSTASTAIRIVASWSASVGPRSPSCPSSSRPEVSPPGRRRASRRRRPPALRRPLRRQRPIVVDRLSPGRTSAVTAKQFIHRRPTRVGIGIGGGDGDGRIRFNHGSLAGRRPAPLARGSSSACSSASVSARATISTACSSVKPSIVFTKSVISITERSS